MYRHLTAIGHRFEHNQAFEEKDAWMLFRIAAFAEAIGWTLLILGIICERVLLPGNHAPVAVAGRIHGMLFIIYIVAAAGLYPNLRWARWQSLLAVMASVPPFGSLLFEQWASYRRRTKQANVYHRAMAFVVWREKATSGTGVNPRVLVS